VQSQPRLAAPFSHVRWSEGGSGAVLLVDIFALAPHCNVATAAARAEAAAGGGKSGRRKDGHLTSVAASDTPKVTIVFEPLAAASPDAASGNPPSGSVAGAAASSDAGGPPPASTAAAQLTDAFAAWEAVAPRAALRPLVSDPTLIQASEVDTQSMLSGATASKAQAPDAATPSSHKLPDRFVAQTTIPALALGQVAGVAILTSTSTSTQAGSLSERRASASSVGAPPPASGAAAAPAPPPTKPVGPHRLMVDLRASLALGSMGVVIDPVTGLASASNAEDTASSAGGAPPTPGGGGLRGLLTTPRDASGATGGSKKSGPLGVLSSVMGALSPRTRTARAVSTSAAALGSGYGNGSGASGYGTISAAPPQPPGTPGGGGGGYGFGPSASPHSGAYQRGGVPMAMPGYVSNTPTSRGGAAGSRGLGFDDGSGLGGGFARTPQAGAPGHQRTRSALPTTGNYHY
jgi:hypothetical protein